MNHEQSIREIVATYELPKGLEQKLTYIATERLGERFVSGFREQYDYVAALVDRYQPSPLADQTYSLDAPLGNDARTLHEMVPCRVPDAEESLESDATPSLESTQRAMAMLRSRLSPSHYRFIDELLEESDPAYHPKPREVRRRFPAIRSRLVELAEAYLINGNIVFPRRPIREIFFKPLKIRFGRRKLGRNPLEYFQKYRHVYRGLRRKEFFDADQGLYQALRTSGQLQEAIAESYKRR